MPYCDHCESVCKLIHDGDSGNICCSVCGKLVMQDIYFNDATFEKTSSGQSKLTGNIIRSVASAYSLSRQKTLDKGRYEISNILLHLDVGSGESLINRAHNLYKIAVERNFTKGRKTSHVAAACLYIACRQTEKAYLLIDFSDYLKINVYVLGAVFLQLCEILRLSDHPIVQKLIDPSLFIHRFTERLLGRRHNLVSEVALRIVASMKRDWMQTGRKPSGLCGAALYISALSHGFNYSKSDVVTVVHICEATLTKRLIEFENTESGSLTIEDFIARADELNDVSQSYQSPTPGQVLCEHKDTNEPHFAHGLCRQCFNEFMKISGGLKGGAEPPAFQNAEKQRTEKARAEAKTDSSSKPFAASTGCETGHYVADSIACNDTEQSLHEEGTGDPESLSDIDDVEVDGYLHNEEEKKYKKIIWEEMNREYLEEQAAKEAAAAAAEAAEKAYAATMSSNFEEFCSAQELASVTAAALENSKKEKKRKRAEEKRNSRPAKSPLEATCQVLKRKSFSSRINYKALESLYTDVAKQQQTETGDGEADNGEVKGLDADAAADGGDVFGTQESIDEDAAADGGDGFETQETVEDRHDYDYDNGYGDGGYYGDVNDNYYHDEDDNYGYGDDDYGYD